ncbi:MAG: hypothetical protein EBU33_02155 [Sphingobacteriia bacterium]|nr:hypothetical protein [Sphingobacteriia bacterium]
MENSLVVTRLEGLSWKKPGVVEIQISNTMLYSNLNKDFQPQSKAYTPFDGVAVGRSINRVGKMAIVMWRFVLGRPIDRAEGDRSPDGMHAEQWSMRAGLGEEDLIRHPNINSIMDKYDGFVLRNRVRFNRYLSTKDKAGNAKQSKNPYYGTKGYFVPSIEFTLERPRGGGISFSNVSNLGHVDFPPLDANFRFTEAASTDKMRAGLSSPWIIVRHSYSKEGARCTESKTWKYGGARGWLNPVYQESFQFSGPNALKDKYSS